MSRRSRAPIRRRGIALPLVALLLTMSGVLRFGMADIAAAREAAGAILSEGDGLAPQPDTVACEPAPDVAALLAAIHARSENLDSRDAALADRMQALRLAELAVDRKLEELVAAERDLARTITMADEAAEGDIARLTAVYENMKPKVAAEVFAAMTPEFAAGFLGRMRPEPAADILSGLAPERAYTISVILAGRNAGAPKE